MASRFVLSVALLLPAAVGCSEPPEPAQPTSESKEGDGTLSPQPAEKTLRITHTITADTEYYLSGPQQGRPPEGTLKAGTEVELIREAGSHALVRAKSGVEAYVSTAVLKPTGPSFPKQ